RLVHPNGLAEISWSNKIYLLDIRNTSNYIWVDKFEPKSISEPTPNTNLPNTPSTTATSTVSVSPNKSDVIIGTLSGIVGTAILTIIGILGYKWYQKRNQNSIMRISGDNL
ncbi:2870_t:CDS:1, partial [Funneliformis caledonium]